MPQTVDEGFRDFLRTLTPLARETVAARQHRASIQQCIKANFGLQRFCVRALSETELPYRVTAMSTTWQAFRDPAFLRIPRTS